MLSGLFRTCTTSFDTWLLSDELVRFPPHQERSFQFLRDFLCRCLLSLDPGGFPAADERSAPHLKASRTTCMFSARLVSLRGAPEGSSPENNNLLPTCAISPAGQRFPFKIFVMGIFQLLFRQLTWRANKDFLSGKLLSFR